MSVVISNSTGANLNFVTAIVDSELEATAAQLLYLHGNNIIYRALTIVALDKFLAEDKFKFQVIYSADFASNDEIYKLIAKYPQFRFTEISKTFDAANFLTEILQSGRQPLLRKQERSQNLISVIGSFGSPGISTVTNQIAARFSEATIIYAGREYLRPQISKLNNLIAITDNNLNSLVLPSGMIFLDAGATSALTATISDRRFSGQLLNWALNTSAKIIYVVKADGRGFTELNYFLNDYRNLISPPPAIFILNQQRFNAPARVFNSQFLSLLTGQIKYQIPYDYAAAVKYPSKKQRWANTFTKQFDLIAKSLA